MTYDYSIINVSLWIVEYVGAQRHCLRQGAVAEQKVPVLNADTSHILKMNHFFASINSYIM